LDGKREPRFLPGSLGSTLSLALLALLSCALAGCGYLRTRTTPLAETATPTPTVRLSMPGRQATATPIPSTPLPTPTATATPTPIVHVVQKGENLLALSFEYGVDVQTLIEVNGIEDPRSLRIGQELIIPPDSETLLAAQPTATPTPMPLEIVNLAYHRTPGESMWCMGEVLNGRDQALDLVQVRASVYNVDGELVAQETGFIAADVVPAQGSAPFALLLNAPRGPVSTEVEVLSAYPITHWGRRHRDLAVQEVTIEDQGDALAIRGTLSNRGDQAAAEIKITLTAYGEEGEVVAVRRVGADPLAPGESRPFEVVLIAAAPAQQVQAAAWGFVPAAE